MTGDASTSSTVIGSRSRADGFNTAHVRAATAYFADLSRPDKHDVPGADVDPLVRCALLKLVAADHESGCQRIDTHPSGNVKEDAAPRHPVGSLGDVTAKCTDTRHHRGVEPIVDLALEDDVTQGVPLRTALQRHDDDVIGRSDIAILAAVEVTRHRVGECIVAVPGHQVDRIEPTEATGLWSGLVEGKPE